MKRVLQFALAGIVVATAVAWYQARMLDDAGNMADTTAAPFSHRPSGTEELQAIRRDESEPPSLQTAAEAAEMPVAGGETVADPVSQAIDEATGTATDWPAPRDHQAGSGEAGILSAGEEIDPATGRVVSRESAAYPTAVAPAQIPPAGIEIDPATGQAIAR